MPGKPLIDRRQERRPTLSIRWTVFGAFALMALAGGSVSVMLEIGRASCRERV